MIAFETINDALLYEIMTKADLVDVAPMTAALLLTLDINDLPAVRQFNSGLLAARQIEIEDQDDGAELVVERYDAMLAALKPYLDRNGDPVAYGYGCFSGLRGVGIYEIGTDWPEVWKIPKSCAVGASHMTESAMKKLPRRPRRRRSHTPTD
jgi:hypothetical protein